MMRDIEEAKAAIENYGLCGIIFLDCFEGMEKLSRLSGIPMVAAFPFSPHGQPGFRLDHSFVSMDKDEMGRIKAKLMLSRGIEKIATTATPGSDTFKTFVDALAENRIKFDPALAIGNGEDMPYKLRKLIESGRVSGVISDGWPQHLERLFELLASLPPESAPELEAPDVPKVEELRKRFPSVKIAGLSYIPEKEIGAAAAKMLLRMLEGQGRQPFELVKPRIVPPRPLER
jgi:DNA-binding LacI/PurR family transcriptional regulator